VITKTEKAEFRAFCEAATDTQLRNVLMRETLARRFSFADIARSVMVQRGIA